MAERESMCQNLGGHRRQFQIRTPPESNDDPAMANVRLLWAKRKAEKMTQEELGVTMRYNQKSARKSDSKFLEGHDPRINFRRKFAKAMGVPLSEIIGGER